MAKPTITYRSSIYDTTSAATYTAAPTWTPAANSLLVAFVGGSPLGDPSGVTGHGLTYSKVVLPTVTLVGLYHMSVWVANAGASPTSAAEVVSIGGTPTGAAVICFEITGWENDEDPINAFGTAIDTTTEGTATSITLNLSLRPDVTSEHVEMAFTLQAFFDAITPRTNWTESAGADGFYSSPSTTAEVQFRTDAFETVASASWTQAGVDTRIIGFVVRGTDTTPLERLKIRDTVQAQLVGKPTITYKASNYVTTAGPTFTAAPTWTPQANSLLVALVVGCSASPTDPTGVTGHGLTYSKVVVPTATLSTTHIMSIWVANAGASPSNVAEVASFGGTPTGNAIICFEILDWAVSEQVINAFGTSINTGTGTGTTGTVTLDLRPDIRGEHVNLSFFLHLANEATTFRTNWTETAGADGNFNTPPTGAEAQYRTDVYELTSTATWSTSALWRGLALTVRGSQTTPLERVKITDTVTAVIPPEPNASVTENLKISDSVTAGLVLEEKLKVVDAGQGRADLWGVVHITDGPVIASLVTTGAGDLSVAVTSEALRISESLSAQLTPLEQAATENLKITDTVQADENPRDVSVSQEALKVVDTVAASRDLTATPTEALKVVDTVTADENPRDVSVAQEALKVVDTVTASVGLSVVVAAEALRISDSVQADENPRDVSVAQEALKVVDGPVIASRDLTATPTEALKVVDIVTADENPRDVLVAQEALKVVDGPVLASRDLTATPTEALSVVDTVAADENPHDLLVAQEALKVVDTVTASVGLSVLVAVESVRISDTVTADENPRDVLVAQEALSVVDGPVATGGDRSATLTEALKVVDTVTADENPRDVLVAQEALKVVDGPVVPAVDRSVVIGAEALRISDSVQADENPRDVSAGQEALKVVDTVAASLNLEASPATEALRITDTVTADENPRPVTVSSENLKITDGPADAGGDLARAVTSEALRIAEILSAQLTPLQQSATENLKVTDSVSAQLTPLEQSASEALRITDTVSASVGLSAALADENFRISDTVTADENPRPVLVAQEALKVVDTVTVVISGSLSVSATEALRITDAVTAQLTPLEVAISAENLKLADTVTASRQQAATVGAEAIRISDSVQASLSHLEAAPASESLRIVDILVASLTVLEVSLSETVYISDAVLLVFIASALPAPPDVVTINATIHRTVTLDAAVHRTVTTDAAVHRTVTIDAER